MIAVLLLAGMAHGELFKDGETVCFLGDSITNGGRYQGVIQNYYLTRFPEWTIRFINAGRSGDTAGGALGRLKEDAIDFKPTSVAVMFGMNDVGRGYYVDNPDEKRIAAQKNSLNGYRKNMETLTACILAEAGNPKLYFMTPSPFDQSGIKALIYIKEWNNYEAYVKHAVACEKEMFAGRAPLPHVYEIMPVDIK